MQSALAASVHSAAPSQSASAELRQRLLVTLLSVLFYYYPSLLTNAWSLFACYKVDRLSGVAYPENSRVRCVHIMHAGFDVLVCNVQFLLKLSSVALHAVFLVTAMRCMLVEMLQHILRCCMQKGLSGNLARDM